jgi:hypothetical protein
MLGRSQLLAFAVAIVAAIVPCRARQKPDSSRADENERSQRAEGQAIVAIADAAMNGDRVPSDIAIDWRNDFLKAQHGTFVPFAVTIDRAPLRTRSVLLYVRLAARGRTVTAAAIEPLTPRAAAPRSTPGRSEDSGSAISVEEVYAIDLRGPPGKPERVMRGFSAPPGEYDLVVVVRERTDDRRAAEPRRAGVLRRRLTVPDFPADQLSTSSIILADRLDVLDRAPANARPEERPYLIGLSEIQPAADAILSRTEELIVVFLVYNPFVTSEGKFDIEVEYHFYAKVPVGGDSAGPLSTGVGRPPAKDGERYFNHTKPQRFTPAILGPQFDPAAGDPLMAGQGVALASFSEGEYRLAIRVTDVVTGKSILRDVTFTVVS